MIALLLGPETKGKVLVPDLVVVETPWHVGTDRWWKIVVQIVLEANWLVALFAMLGLLSRLPEIEAARQPREFRV